MTELENLLVQLEHTKGDIDNLKLQYGIFISRFESERETARRRHGNIDLEVEKIRKEMNDEIEKVEKQWHDIIFNRETGIAFVIDRLLEKDKKREALKAQMIGMWIALGMLILKEVINYFTHKS